jgi:hypothetical protein
MRNLLTSTGRSNGPHRPREETARNLTDRIKSPSRIGQEGRRGVGASASRPRLRTS